MGSKTQKKQKKKKKEKLQDNIYLKDIENEQHSHKSHNFRDRFIIGRKFLRRSPMLKVILVVFFLNIICALIFMEIEHKPFHEALYWATDTLTNTGTGLAALNTNAAWYLTTFLMWVGLGVTLFFIEFVYTHLLQKERKMLKVQNHILLIGWNQKIRHFLQNLEGLGADHNYVCIAKVDDRPYDLPEIVMLVHGNPEEERILKKAGIEQAQQAIIAVEDDSMAILIALTAQSLNPKLKLTININFSENIKHLKRIKVEQIVCDEELAGDHLLESFYSNLKENKKK